MPYSDSSSAAAKASQRRRSQAWAERNPTYSRDYQRTEKNRLAKREWKKRNPGYAREAWQRKKDQVFLMYGEKCARCKFSDKRALQLDHVNNDGAKNRVSRKTGMRVTKCERAWYDAAKAYRPDKYQILCANCNWIKRYE